MFNCCCYGEYVAVGKATAACMISFVCGLVSDAGIFYKHFQHCKVAATVQWKWPSCLIAVVMGNMLQWGKLQRHAWLALSAVCILCRRDEVFELCCVWYNVDMFRCCNDTIPTVQENNCSCRSEILRTDWQPDNTRQDRSTTGSRPSSFVQDQAKVITATNSPWIGDVNPCP